jgi:hypothetical protein
MCITLFLVLEKVENVICNTAMSKYVIVHIKKNHLLSSTCNISSMADY